MDRLELLRRWNDHQKYGAISRPRDWLRWRVAKKWARWTGHSLKRETRLFWGQTMSIVYPEYVSSRIGRYGYFEDDLTAMLLDVLRPGMTVYDIGSHFGFFSLLASEIVGKSGKVFAFEPTPSTYGMLSENASRCDNITCVNSAAFSETSTLSFLQQKVAESALNFIVRDTDRYRTTAENGHLIEVSAVAIDDFVIDQPEPDFLKIDAEGAEGPILEGMVELIRRSHPGISLEMGDRINEKTGNRPCSQNVEFLFDHGYEALDYENGRPEKHVLEHRYKYQNLFFRHPNWKFMNETATQPPQDRVAIAN